MKGTLIVRPKSAQLIIDTEFFGKMDPFVEITLGSQKRKTKIAKSAGKLPIWIDEFQFNVDGSELLTFKVFDHDTFSRNDLIGEGFFYLSSIGGGNGGKIMESLPITRKGKPTGQVLMEFNLFLNQQNVNQRSSSQRNSQTSNT